MHLTLSCLTYQRSGMGGDLQESFDKFPTPGDNFMLEIPYIWCCIGIPKQHKITLY